MLGVRVGGLWGAGLVLGVASGCPRLPGYACDGDGDCDRGGEAGTCLPDGACAYPSDACESGLVRSPNAIDRPGECEPVSFASTTDSASDGGSGTGVIGPGTADSGPVPSCGQRVAITIDTAFLGTAEVLEGYPLVVVLDDAALVAALVQSGEDPVITDAAGVPLPQELERLDAAAGTLTLWVRLPAYALGEPLPLELRWGGGAAAGDPTAVWAERYAGVWHLGDALSGIDGDEIANSARPLEPGLTAGQMAPEQSEPAVVGHGLRFDGDDDVVTIAAGFVGQLDSYALELWVRFDGPADAPGDYFQRLNGHYFYPRCWRVADGYAYCQYYIEDTVTGLGSVEHGPGQRLHLALVRDATTGSHRVYFDGELVDENLDTLGAVLQGGDDAFELGHGELGTLPGVLDEVRVSEAPLPEAWVRADYRTQLQPGAVIESVGAIEDVPCP